MSGGWGETVRRMEFILCNLREIKQKLFTRAFSEGMEHSVKKPVHVATGDSVSETRAHLQLEFSAHGLASVPRVEVCSCRERSLASVQVVLSVPEACSHTSTILQVSLRRLAIPPLSLCPAPQCIWGSRGGVCCTPPTTTTCVILWPTFVWRSGRPGEQLVRVLLPWWDWGGLRYLCGWEVPRVVVRWVTAV